jgi:hypothetical protein
MTQKKKISQTLSTILEDPIVVSALDRSQDITPVLNEAIGWWSYDLMSRKPSPALMEQGLLVEPTDLDLICFLWELAGRKAVINIPKYKTMTKAKVRVDQKLTSKQNRHGELLWIQGNKESFVFSIGVKDMNVIGQDSVGDFRNFSLTNFDGTFYPGWNVIEFTPTINENKWITESKLWTGNKIVFKHMIHPNRWVSLFGKDYVRSKIIEDRVEEEVKWLNEQIKAILATGVQYPKGEGPAKYEYKKPGKYDDEGKRIKITAFDVRVYIPEMGMRGEYPSYTSNQKTLVEFYHKKKILSAMVKKLRVMTRATEYAHFKAPDRFPAWIENCQWESGFREPGKRTDWERLKLFQPEPGKYSVSILKRTYQKSTEVSESY